jgi:hypothetical protein
MLARRKELILARRKERFAEPFYIRHRSHLSGPTGPAGCGTALLAAAGAVVLVNLIPIFAGWDDQYSAWSGDLIRAGVAAAIFLLLVWGLVAGVRDQFQVRVLPYFERPVGGIDTWLAGENLLWHSRSLDEAAARCGVAPLSAFASGDDLIPGEELSWFDPSDALRTAERVLEADVAQTLPAGVVTDLERLRDALRRASAQGIRFCLLVREGSVASGHEMSLRKGSFF